MKEKQKEDYSEEICCEPGCFNAPASGYILCHGHIWGFPKRASAEAIQWKMDQQKKSIEERIGKQEE
jgi:hypothetical protein